MKKTFLLLTIFTLVSCQNIPTTQGSETSNALMQINPSFNFPLFDSIIVMPQGEEGTKKTLENTNGSHTTVESYLKNGTFYAGPGRDRGLGNPSLSYVFADTNNRLDLIDVFASLQSNEATTLEDEIDGYFVLVNCSFMTLQEEDQGKIAELELYDTYLRFPDEKTYRSFHSLITE